MSELKEQSCKLLYIVRTIIKNAYNSRSRRVISILIGLAVLLCKISLQFGCDFIKNNKPNILLVRRGGEFIMIPISALRIMNDTLTWYHQDPKKGWGVIETIGQSSSLGSGIIEILMRLKIIHLVTNNNATAISHLGLTSSILFLFISEPISFYSSYQKYCDNKTAKNKKSLIVNSIILPLILAKFISTRVGDYSMSINLGHSIEYYFILAVTIDIMYSAVLIALQVDKLSDQPIDPPNTETDIDEVVNQNNEPSVYSKESLTV